MRLCLLSAQTVVDLAVQEMRVDSPSDHASSVAGDTHAIRGVGVSLRGRPFRIEPNTGIKVRFTEHGVSVIRVCQ